MQTNQDLRTMSTRNRNRKVLSEPDKKTSSDLHFDDMSNIRIEHKKNKVENDE